MFKHTVTKVVEIIVRLRIHFLIRGKFFCMKIPVFCVIAFTDISLIISHHRLDYGGSKDL